MNARPKLSVVIPTSDRCEILRLCLAHIEAQNISKDAFEVIVVDDGSTDDTHIFLTQYIPEFAFRHFRQETKGGPARARNVGILAAKGEIVLFLNDDALLEPDGLRVHLDTHLAANGLAMSVLGRFELPQSSCDHLWGYTLTNSDLVFDYGALRTDTLYGGGYYYTCNISTPRKALLEVGLFDESFTGKYWGAEDIELGHRLAHLDPPVGVLFREGCAAVHQHELTVTDFARMFRVRGGGAVRMFAKHPAMVPHYRNVGAADILFWRDLPVGITKAVARLHALLRKTESMPVSEASRASLLPTLLRESNYPDFHRTCLGLWRLKTPELLALVGQRIREMDSILETVACKKVSMEEVAQAIYPSCLFLRWFHDTEGVCLVDDIVRICREPLPDSGLKSLQTVLDRHESSRKSDADCTQMQTLDNSPVFRFTVVTAGYNAAPWLQEYFTSLARQSLDFAHHIQVVFVDDGSTDDTATIVARWARKYPDNITLLSRENGGPASARNLGLLHARGEWVTFIDADDFVSGEYFAKVDRFLSETAFAGSAVACKLISYHEREKSFCDDHPLSYKFAENCAVNLLERPGYVQLSASSCFVRRECVERTGVRFDERIRPSFEDAHFLCILMMRSGSCEIAFLKDALYFYRKRKLSGSLVSSGWERPEKYRDQLLYGYFDLLRQYASCLGVIPAFVQNTVLYDLGWYVEKMFDGKLPYDFSEENARSYLDLLELVFHHIDARQVLGCEVPTLSLRVRVAMLLAFKGIEFQDCPFVLSEIAPGGTHAQVVRWTGRIAQHDVASSGVSVDIAWSKNIEHRFAGKLLCYEQRLWVPFVGDKSICTMSSGKRVGIMCGGILYDELTGSQAMKGHYRPESQMQEAASNLLARVRDTAAKSRFKGCWVLMDRVHKADDNAEHFYRWLKQNDDVKWPIYFVLDRKSPDWDRLAGEGFFLLPYGSHLHAEALYNAEWLISSHVDPPVTDPFGTRELYGVPEYKLAFLQHGIIKDDLSRWLNTIRLDCFVTSSRKEYDSILGGRYKFTERELVLTGLPRHDTLLNKSGSSKLGRRIMFCPTWREHLRHTEAHLAGLDKPEAESFIGSDFFKAWDGVLRSEILAEVAQKMGYRMLFLPHPELVRFLPLFGNSGAFTFLDYATVASVQDLIVSSSMLVTDYSSLAMEAAYIGKSVVYYQFAESPNIFSTHVYSKGYFEYERDGFGPVVTNVNELVETVASLTKEGGGSGSVYKQRSDSFFEFKDKRSCLRLYNCLLER